MNITKQNEPAQTPPLVQALLKPPTNELLPPSLYHQPTNNQIKFDSTSSNAIATKVNVEGFENLMAQTRWGNGNTYLKLAEYERVDNTTTEYEETENHVWEEPIDSVTSEEAIEAVEAAKKAVEAAKAKENNDNDENSHEVHKAC